MKSLAAILLCLSLFACHTTTTAQYEQKLRNDPTYSPNNYKQSNKAATARRWTGKDGVPVQAPPPQDIRLANYKNQLPGQPPVFGITVPHSPNENLASRNYKMQLPSVNANKDSISARKRAKKRLNSTIGD